MSTVSKEFEEKVFAALGRKEAVPQEPVAQTEPQPEPPKVDEPKAEPTKEEKEVDPDPEPEPPKVEEPKEEPQKGWDDDDEPVVEAPKFDFSELVSDLELGEIKSKDDLKAKVVELKSKLKTLEEKPLAAIPEELSEVFKVAQTGGWDAAKEYLANQLIDYSKATSADAIIEFENDFFERAKTNQKYYTDGKLDPAKVEEDLDSMPEVVREQYGYAILRAKAEQQARIREQLKAQAEAKRAQAEKALAQASQSLGELLPVEAYGIKFEPKHSSEIYNGITSSKLTKKHLGLSYEDLVRSGADMKAVVRSITLAEKGEKMIKFKSNQSEVKAKKEILEKTQNVQLNNPGTAVTPEDPEKKPIPLHEKVRMEMEKMKRGL